MIQSQEFHSAVADRLTAAAAASAPLTAFVGLDGFVDEILQVVDRRQDAEHFDAVPTIAAYAARLAAAAGKSTNVELVNVMTKLGGNGPIMANALAHFGIAVTYVGSLGWPALHPVFAPFALRANVHSICGPGLTDALEFSDGKIMVGKHYTLKEVNWKNLMERFGRDGFASHLGSASLVGFVNWTMLPHMSDIWASIQSEILPTMTGPRRRIFFDLADPEKRLPEDIRRALDLILGFQSHFDCILGLNEKEAVEIGHVLGLSLEPTNAEELAVLGVEIQKRIPVETLVIHPTAYACAVSAGRADVVAGSVCRKPRITTGAGDHFNSGFCLGKLLGLSNADSLLCGVSTSGHYVRTAESPSIPQIADFMRRWPAE